jgi:hypothetical protein
MSRTEWSSETVVQKPLSSKKAGGVCRSDGGSAAREGTSDTTRLIAAGDAFTYICRYAELFGKRQWGAVGHGAPLGRSNPG